MTRSFSVIECPETPESVPLLLSLRPRSSAISPSQAERAKHYRELGEYALSIDDDLPASEAWGPGSQGVKIIRGVGSGSEKKGHQEEEGGEGRGSRYLQLCVTDKSEPDDTTDRTAFDGSPHTPPTSPPNLLRIDARWRDSLPHMIQSPAPVGASLECIRPIHHRPRAPARDGRGNEEDPHPPLGKVGCERARACESEGEREAEGLGLGLSQSLLKKPSAELIRRLLFVSRFVSLPLSLSSSRFRGFSLSALLIRSRYR